MTYFKSIMLAGAVALTGVFSAGNADALPFSLSGKFTIDAVNFKPNGSTPGVRSNQSQATAANFTAAWTGALGTVNGTTTFTYDGALDFRQPHNSGITTTASFLASSFGSYNGGPSAASALGIFGGLVNSAGEGTGDPANSDPFTITTLYKITAISLNIADLADLFDANHDDGVTFLGSNGSSVASVGPNSELNLKLKGKLSGGVKDFTLYYASANGDPSVLEVNAIPLPAAAWLLLGVAGALVAAKRRSSLRAA